MHASLGCKWVAFMKSRTLYEIVRKAVVVAAIMSHTSIRFCDRCLLVFKNEHEVAFLL